MSKRPRLLIKHGLAVAAAVFLLAWSGWAMAQVVPPQMRPAHCQAHADMVDALVTKYSEQQHAVGVQHNGLVVEVYRTDDGATWTILLTRPNGMSCIVAAGTDWEDVDPGPPDQPASFKYAPDAPTVPQDGRSWVSWQDIPREARRSPTGFLARSRGISEFEAFRPARLDGPASGVRG